MEAVTPRLIENNIEAAQDILWLFPKDSDGTTEPTHRLEGFTTDESYNTAYGTRYVQGSEIRLIEESTGKTLADGNDEDLVAECERLDLMWDPEY